jgi:hypothetical protein
MNPQGKLILTAASEFLVSDLALQQGVIAKAVDYYSPFGLDIYVAVAAGSKDKILRYGNEFGSKASIVEVPLGTRGAMATAVCALSKVGFESGELFIAAGDTYFTGDSALDGMDKLRHSEFEAGTLVFPSSDDRHSFVAFDAQGAAQLVAEKQKIGPNATSGNFYFASSGDFLKAAEWCFVNNSTHKGNFYVSGALNFFIYQGRSVGVSLIDPAQVEKHWPNSVSER